MRWARGVCARGGAGAERAARCAKYELYKYTMEQRVYPALQMLKACDSEAQRGEYHVALALVMPRPEDKKLDRLSKKDALNFAYGGRSTKDGKRPYAADRAMQVRAAFEVASERQRAFDAAVKHFRESGNLGRLQQLVEPGAKVLAGSDGAEAELSSFTPSGGCVLTFRGGNSEEQQTFTSLFGNKEGSEEQGATRRGLRLPPPSLAPPPRETRKDDVLATVGPLVLAHADEVCPTSPCKRDAMRRHVGPRVYGRRVKR